MGTGEPTESGVHAWLASRGFPEWVVRGGAEELVRAWELAARELAENWTTNMTAFVKGLDGRQTLEQLSRDGLLDEHETKRVHLADHQFMGATQESAECVAGADAATKNAWSKEKEWWYWRKPLS